MVNLSQGVDELPDGQSKLFLEILKIQELQRRQLVSAADAV